jgi:tRNA nucleotidyltransferase (CCA-adding enzyme)
VQAILTHEHADFDAIASLLAANKLNPSARPILPRRVNRNVRHFLTLYWEALPFVRPEDLPRGTRIDRVILVDTQGLTSVRGMRRKLNVHVIDHHPPAEDFNREWQFEGEPIGAATTLLVERFAEHGVQPSPIEATLMLLGIYEDTGSLTYNATTARDVRCAAWLLDHGANLTLLNRFLHHPLTDEQRELYRVLQENAEVHEFEGQSVVVAVAIARDYVDEISTLVHKMRDLYDPDAVIVLVQLEHHIQLVARSTADTIDVSKVAAYFEGGGHERAAAAIVRDRSLKQAHDELLQVLPGLVKPVVTVAEIMSHGVETVSPETPIREVHEKALRFGYEGYPVVADGRIAGLLTRRDIDRALQHRMGDSPARRFMSHGEVSVDPSDPVSKVQSLMMEHGWGQIPVVSAEDGHVIGIVTRTDVIKLWQPRPAVAEREEVTRRLVELLPPPVVELVSEIGQVAQGRDIQVYFVGGLVRDLLLGISNMDLDIVVEGDAISLARELVRRLGGRVRTHARFRTAKWILEEPFWAQFLVRPGATSPPVRTIDFVTARSEFYERPTALPQVTQSSIKLDLHRRDFTINTLAIRLNPDRFGELLDFYGGKRDLDGGLIRVLHSLSFIDDPTRILRAVRFEQRLGFSIEARTLELLQESVSLLDRVSGDRIRHELELLLREPRPERGFARLGELGILRQIHPALGFHDWERLRFVELRTLLGDPVWAPEVDDYLIEFTHFALLTFRMDLVALEVFERRLRVQRATAENIRLLHALKADLSRLAETQMPSQVYRILEPYPASILLVAYVANGDRLVRELIRRFVHEWRDVRPTTTGRDLKAMGLRPGPRFSEILEELLYARLDGRVVTDDEERAYLEQLIGQAR